MVPKFSSHGNGHSDINSTTNDNPHPSMAIYPKRSVHDACYRVHENDLHSAIFIPAHFNYGQDSRVPVLLIPGTGSMGGEAFESNFAKLLTASTFGDPVWLNVPGRMCDDASKNAEFVAYAINYISAICSSKIAVIAWSQGTLSVQWSLKYWPSTRSQVSNFIALSGVFRGTIAARLLAPTNGVPCSPAIWQQKRNSNFTTTLMSNGGDSAYVPTTSIYSRTDEVVQPQFGKRASALLHDERGVGVTNCEIQAVVGKKPAALMYTHFSM
ncbi:alpha/beta-hydrolase [Cadophora sp. DSE1049]|nr:alpha/beta-hydrolase [Cadophora sp. DSE1049]